jgi:hypothetical protein
MDSWTCLMVGKDMGMVPPDLTNILKACACVMRMEKLDRMPIIHDRCSGVMETNWNTHSVGARSGVLFKSAVDYGGISTQVNFLFHERDLKAGAELLRRGGEVRPNEWWATYSGHLDNPDLYKFGNLRPYRLN